VKIGKFIRFIVIFGRINSRIQTFGNYLFIIQLLKKQLLKTIRESDRSSLVHTVFLVTYCVAAIFIFTLLEFFLQLNAAEQSGSTSMLCYAMLLKRLSVLFDTPDIFSFVFKGSQFVE
jgi:hypothetical protein